MDRTEQVGNSPQNSLAMEVAAAAKSGLKCEGKRSATPLWIAEDNERSEAASAAGGGSRDEQGRAALVPLAKSGVALRLPPAPDEGVAVLRLASARIAAVGLDLRDTCCRINLSGDRGRWRNCMGKNRFRPAKKRCDATALQNRPVGQ